MTSRFIKSLTLLHFIFLINFVVAMKVELIFVRHGETTANRDGILVRELVKLLILFLIPYLSCSKGIATIRLLIEVCIIFYMLTSFLMMF